MNTISPYLKKAATQERRADGSDHVASLAQRGIENNKPTHSL